MNNISLRYGKCGSKMDMICSSGLSKNGGEYRETWECRCCLYEVEVLFLKGDNFENVDG